MLSTFSFSDPCLAANSDNESKDSGNNQNSSKDESTKMLTTILEQISVLHETNTKICRNLHENKGKSAMNSFLIKLLLLFFFRWKTHHSYTQ